MGDEKQMSSSSGPTKTEEDDTERTGDERSLQNVIRTVSNMSDEQKLVTIQKKYDELYKELVAMEMQYANAREELQRRNIIVDEQTIDPEKEEEERSRGVAGSSTKMLNSASTQTEEKDDLLQKSEEHLSNVNRETDLQMEVADHQFQTLVSQIENERQLFEEERQISTANFEASERVNRTLAANLHNTHSQIESYNEQYNEFKSSMTSYTKAFEEFKAELEKLQRTNVTLVRERDDYLRRWKSCNKSMTLMSNLNQYTINEMEILQRQLPSLEKVCSDLNAERSAYQRQLLAHNIIPIFGGQSPQNQPETPRYNIPPSRPGTPHPAARRVVVERATRQQEAYMGNLATTMKRKRMEDDFFVEVAKICRLDTEIELEPYWGSSSQAGPYAPTPPRFVQPGPSSRPDMPDEDQNDVHGDHLDVNEMETQEHISAEEIIPSMEANRHSDDNEEL